MDGELVAIVFALEVTPGADDEGAECCGCMLVSTAETDCRAGNSHDCLGALDGIL